MKIEKSKIKLWSNIGSRATFGLVALELAKSINDLMILTSDVSTSAGLDRFKVKFPDKYLDVGIAEQNLIGIAAGLSSEGMNVFTTTFSPSSKSTRKTFAIQPPVKGSDLTGVRLRTDFKRSNSTKITNYLLLLLTM